MRIRGGMNDERRKNFRRQLGGGKKGNSTRYRSNRENKQQKLGSDKLKENNYEMVKWLVTSQLKKNSR